MRDTYYSVEDIGCLWAEFIDQAPTQDADDYRDMTSQNMATIVEAEFMSWLARRDQLLEAIALVEANGYTVARRQKER